MTHRSILLGVLVALAVGIGVPSAAAAMSESKTAQGEKFVSGGIAVGEREALESRKGNFNLWVVTAAKGSGAYLAGAAVKITDRSGKTILETTLDGPWLIVDLEPGEYAIDAHQGGHHLRKSTTIREGDHRQINLYFDIEDDNLRRNQVVS